MLAPQVRTRTPRIDDNRGMTPLDITLLRLANQQITDHPSKTPREVVAALGAMQAQEYRSALWAIGLRLPGTCEADIERAVASAAIVRTWALRGTLHFVASADVRWVRELLAPRIIAARAYRRRRLEIDDLTLARSRDLFANALSHGKLLARDEMVDLLQSAGIETTGQRGIHILSHLSLEGLLCQAAVADKRTGGTGRREMFALLAEWVPDARAMNREDSLAELARRYFGSHGPATLQDFVWWSGLTVADARVGIELAKPGLASEKNGSEKNGAAVYWVPTRSSSSSQASAPPPTGQARTRAAASDAPVLCLLPGFDEYVLGYKDRGIALDADTYQRVIPGDNGGNGVFRPTIMLDGRAIGTWRLGSKSKAATVVDLFSPLDAATSRSLTEALRRYDDFARI